MQITSIRNETFVAPVPLTAKMVRIETEKRHTANTIEGSVEILAAINSLSFVKMESNVEGATRTAIENTREKDVLSKAILLINGIT